MGKSFRVVFFLMALFGLRWRYLGLLLFRIFLTSFTAATLFLDHLFFRRTIMVPLKEPVFLIGHLRSGTTFLHRYLTAIFPSFRSLLLWEMVFPALTARALLTPFLPIMRRMSFNTVYDPNIHETGLFEPETDDIALSMRYFDGLLSWIYFYAWRDYPNDEELERALAATVEKEHFVDYLGAVYRRAVGAGGKRMFSKSFCLLFNIEIARKRFPGAKFLLIVRDPVEAIVSLCSLERSVQRRINDFDRIAPDLQKRYFRNLYRTSLIYYRRFCDEAAKNPPDTLVIRYPELFTDFEGTMRRVADFLALPVTPEIETLLREQAVRQGDFSSKHRYMPEEFGFTAEEIRRDFAFVYRQFDV